MHSYQQLVRAVLARGVRKTDRTGTGTLSLFGQQWRCNLRQQFPLLTAKRVPFKAVAHELLWFLRGDTNVQYLHENGVTIWDEWADKDGNLGPIYGQQWRSWPTRDGRTVDQIAEVVRLLRTDPDSRRILVSAWNPGDLDAMALAPCHCLFQFYVANGRLSCQLYQRSADLFLGVPFNIASYALLTHMLAHTVRLGVGDLVVTFGDVHLYANHLEQARELVNRMPKAPPELVMLKRCEALEDYRFEDFEIRGYDPHPAIPAPVAV